MHGCQGMVDAMDHRIARLIKHLKAIKQYPNTGFIFTSDNGAEYSGGEIASTAVVRVAMKQLDYTLETIGMRDRIRLTLLLQLLKTLSFIGVYGVYRQRSNHL
jgi:arylsulfatase A-like enzyme